MICILVRAEGALEHLGATLARVVWLRENDGEFETLRVQKHCALQVSSAAIGHLKDGVKGGGLHVEAIPSGRSEDFEVVVSPGSGEVPVAAQRVEIRDPKVCQRPPAGGLPCERFWAHDKV